MDCCGNIPRLVAQEKPHFSLYLGNGVVTIEYFEKYLFEDLASMHAVSAVFSRTNEYIKNKAESPQVKGDYSF